jgi:Cu(I)/Ag(I) efflux system protein CusF
MTKMLSAASLAVALLAPFAYAAAAAPDKAGGAASQAEQSLADGEVRKVDKSAKKLTIRHGPMPQLDMPQPMTMVYQVKDPAMLDQVKAGDKVKFSAEKIGGAFTVTKIEPAQ